MATRHGVGTIVQPAAAGMLRSGAPRYLSNTVGVLIAGLDPFYLDLLRGIEEKAEEEGTLVLIVNTQDSEHRANAAIRQLTARGAQGIIAVSIGGPESGDALRSLPPIVYVDQPDRRGEVLVFDAERAAYDATRHLLEHGHSHIGYVTFPVEVPNQGELYEGHRRALVEAGLEADQVALATVEDFGVASGRRGLVRLIEQGFRPTAVIASGAMLAVGILQEARQRGLDVPTDLAIVGYADVDVTRSTSGPHDGVATDVRCGSNGDDRSSADDLRRAEEAGTRRLRRYARDPRSCGPHRPAPRGRSNGPLVDDRVTARA